MLLVCTTKLNIMKTNYLLILLILVSFTATSQIGINTTNPDPSSILDISSENKGVLFPRIALNGKNDANPILNPAEGLLVYNTTNNGALSSGFYVWDGSTWDNINTGESSGGGSGSNDAWSLNGNNGSSNDFLGTTNWSSLQFKVNNSQMALFHPNGGMALGYNAVANKNNSVAIGTGANASARNEATALGASSTASGFQSAAVGYNAKAINSNSTLALGNSATASSFQATAIGVNANANSNNNALAIGTNSEAKGENSSALGTNSLASAQNAMAVGYGAVANQANTLILGNNSPASNWNGTKVGVGTSKPDAKLDVNGTYKLGSNGNVHKGVTSFSKGTNLGAITAGDSNIITISIPNDARPSSTKATIVVTPDNGMSDDFVIAWSKLQNTSTLRLKILNASKNSYSNTYTTFYVTITEF